MRKIAPHLAQKSPRVSCPRQTWGPTECRVGPTGHPAARRDMCRALRGVRRPSAPLSSLRTTIQAREGFCSCFFGVCVAMDTNFTSRARVRRVSRPWRPARAPEEPRRGAHGRQTTWSVSFPNTGDRFSPLEVALWLASCVAFDVAARSFPVLPRQVPRRLPPLGLRAGHFETQHPHRPPW